MMHPPAAYAAYAAWLAGLKTRIHATRLRTALAVNSELIGSTGRSATRSRSARPPTARGAGIVRRLAADFKAEFPDARGFSRANLLYMRAFAVAWADPAIVQRIVGQLPRGQNIELLAIKDPGVTSALRP